MTRVQTQQALRQLPVKWALALLVLIVIYAVAQPALNSRLGWNLPSLARLMGEPEPKAKVTKEAKTQSKDSQSKDSKETPTSPSPSKSKRETANASEADDSQTASNTAPRLQKQTSQRPAHQVLRARHNRRTHLKPMQRNRRPNQATPRYCMAF